MDRILTDPELQPVYGPSVTAVKSAFVKWIPSLQPVYGPSVTRSFLFLRSFDFASTRLRSFCNALIFNVGGIRDTASTRLRSFCNRSFASTVERPSVLQPVYGPSVTVHTKGSNIHFGALQPVYGPSVTTVVTKRSLSDRLVASTRLRSFCN